MVPNHGARQLDRAPAPIDMLPAIRSAVPDNVEITLDGGVRRGADIVTALCLGANAVFIGRPALYGAIVGGAAGVNKVLSLLIAELEMVLGQMGCARTADLGPQFISTSSLTTPGALYQRASMTGVCPIVGVTASTNEPASSRSRAHSTLQLMCSGGTAARPGS